MSSTHALVTILIPTYNRADYLPGTIQSVLDQTWPSVEVVVADDASTDETENVMAGYARDSRVRHIRHPHNLGMAGNWKAAMTEVRGEFFCLLNDDDRLEPDFVEKLVRPMLANPELILAFCDHHVMDGDGKTHVAVADRYTERHGRARLTSGVVEDFASAVVDWRSLHISCTLFRTSMVPPDFLDERSGGFACGWLFYRCYRTGKSAWYEARRLSSYRIHFGNMLGSARWEKYLLEGQVFWLRHMLNDTLPGPVARLVRDQAARIFASYGSGRLAAGDRRMAGELFTESWRSRRNVKALAGLLLCRLGPVGSLLIQNLKRTIKPNETGLQAYWIPFCLEWTALNPIV